MYNEEKSVVVLQKWCSKLPTVAELITLNIAIIPNHKILSTILIDLMKYTYKYVSHNILSNIMILSANG